jgi:hypothetical protein
MGFTREEEDAHSVDQQHMFDRGALFLAAITRHKLNRIVGPWARGSVPSYPKRGAAGTSADAGGSDGVGDFGTGTTGALASIAAALRRFTNSVTNRVGASPSARSIACRTVNKT